MSQAIHLARYQVMPDLESAEYQNLKDDIALNGVQVPVEIDENGQILDGHHRVKACAELGITEYPRIIRTGLTDDDKKDHARRLNILRRHLTADQKQTYRIQRRQEGASYRQIASELNEGRSTTAENLSTVRNRTVELPSRIIGRDGRDRPASRPSVIVSTERETNQALTLLDSVAPTRPIASLADLQRSAAAAQTVQTHSETRERIALVEPPIGTYRCVVIDPPWPMKKIARDVRPNQAEALDYPTMTLEEIEAMVVPHLLDKAGCHVYMWVTQKFLPAGLDLFKAWGINYQCLMTWVKPGGFTPYSWMYNTEHVLFGRVGDLDLLRMGRKLSFEAPATGHSVKPDLFYDLVTECSPGPRLELFSRTEREGFTSWGSESGR